MKHILLKTKLIVLSLFLTIGLFSQTVSIDDYVYDAGDVGTTVSIALNTSDISLNYGNIYTGAITVNFDTDVLVYTGYSNYNVGFPGTVQFVVNPTGVDGVLRFNFLEETNPLGFLWPEGKVLDMEFTFLGGSTVLDITQSEFLATDFETYNATMVDGSAEGYYNNTISGGDWNTAGNWSALKVADAWANVTVAPGTETTIGAAAVANNLTIAQGGQLTSNSTLNVAGNFLIESNASGSGSFINNGTLTGTTDVTVENYLAAGYYHGISMPVSGETSSAFMGAPDQVFLKYYNTATNDYTNILNYGEGLNVGQGYMIKVAGGTPYTPTYNGTINTGASVTLNTSGFGYNFIGNPFTSALDWNSSTGWTGKENTDGTIWVYNNGTFDTYTSLTDGEVAMNQGFFVKATSAGNLEMDNQVCVHHNVPFKSTNAVDQLVKLQISDAEKIDKFLLAFVDGATIDFDISLDGHKMFSFNEEHPQLYSTMNENLAINALPVDYRQAIPMDVRGVNGHTMTISATETAGFDKLYLKDEAAGTIVNLVEESYTFSYNADVTDRFTLFFSITDVEENTLSSNAKVFAYDNTIQVVVSGIESADVTVFNLLGQAVDSRRTSGTVTRIPVQKSGYYLVKVSNGSQVSTQKVFIK